MFEDRIALIEKEIALATEEAAKAYFKVAKAQDDAKEYIDEHYRILSKLNQLTADLRNAIVQQELMK